MDGTPISSWSVSSGVILSERNLHHGVSECSARLYQDAVSRGAWGGLFLKQAPDTE